MSKLSRRALVGTAAIAGVGALPSVKALPAIPPQGRQPAMRGDCLDDLAKLRDFIARLNTIDAEVGAAEVAHDAARTEAAEAEYGRLHDAFLAFATDVQSKEPVGWPDVIARAEIVAQIYTERRFTEWETLVDHLDDEVSSDERANLSLALAVLWLANREGEQAHGRHPQLAKGRLCCLKPTTSS